MFRLSKLNLTQVLLAVSVTSIFLFGGACKSRSDAPREALNKFLAHRAKGETERMWDLISSRDRSVPGYDLAGFVDGNDWDRMEKKAFPGKFTWKILELQTSGDMATASVQISDVILPPSAHEFMWKKIYETIFLEDQKEKEAKEAGAIGELTVRYGGEVFPSTTAFQNFTLVREPEGWRVFKNWAAEKQAREANRNQALDYAKKFFSIYDVNVSLYDDGTIFVKGWIKNQSPKKASTVTLRINLLDNEGQPFSSSEKFNVAGGIGPQRQADFINSFFHMSVPKGWKKRVSIEYEEVIFEE